MLEIEPRVSLIHARQALYHVNHIPAPLFFCILFLRQGLVNFAWADLELLILLPLQEGLQSEPQCPTSNYLLSLRLELDSPLL
jgi:hypothetical protein